MTQAVRIGALIYSVVEVVELANGSCELHGDINYGKCRIRLCADDHAQVQHITLWHEILHGILHQAALTDHNEQVIDALAHGIVSVLRDNPAWEQR